MKIQQAPSASSPSGIKKAVENFRNNINKRNIKEKCPTKKMTLEVQFEREKIFLTNHDQFI